MRRVQPELVELADGVLEALFVVEALRRDVDPVLEAMRVLILPFDYFAGRVLEFQLVEESCFRLGLGQTLEDLFALTVGED